MFTNGDHCTSPQRGDKLTDTHIQATQSLYPLYIFFQLHGMEFRNGIPPPPPHSNSPGTHSKSSTATGCCRLWNRYAIAYAFHAARREDIEFGQDKIRQYLARCLNDSFSTLKRRARVSPYPWFPCRGRSVLHLRNAGMSRQHDTM